MSSIARIDELAPLLPESGTIEVEGCEVRWYAGGKGRPTLMLVHGGGAHAGWWEPALQRLSEHQRIVAMDLSGHGDSGHRPDGYPSLIWVAEIAAVLLEVAGPSALIGHSLGGRLGTTTAARHPELVDALVTLDSVVPPYEDEPVPVVRPRKLYDSEGQILGAFRLMPPQPPADPALMERLGRRSIIRVPGGRYTWKFDPTIFHNMADRFGVNQDIPLIRCPVTLVQGGLSELTSRAMAEKYQALLGRELEIVDFPESHHHIPLDASEKLLALLRRLPGTRPR
jgi:pimeloyl-ACP methyl ester carboxylesterase